MSDDYQPLANEDNYRLALDLLRRLEEADVGDVLALPGVDEGPCDDCGRTFARVRVLYGRFTLCR